MKELTLPINYFPSLTWHHLHINGSHIDGYIDSALKPTKISISEGISINEVEGYNSAFAELSETQLGKKADSIFDEAIKEKTCPVNEYVVESALNKEVSAFIEYDIDSSIHSIADSVIIANENTKSTFIFYYKSAKDIDGLLAHRIRVYAKPFSSVDIVTVNLLSEKMQFMSGIGTVAQEGAAIDVSDLELGASKVYTGSSHELLGFKSSVNTRVGYIGSKDRQIDINYIANHIGKETESSGIFNGALLDTSSKAWRGTINFKNGCSESKGNEQEDVVLLSPNAINKSLPVILCDEEAVEGSHGSSIGKLGSDVLFYLQSRGIDEKTAKSLMIKSKINTVCSYIKNESLVQDIQNFMEGVY